jgi:hypothetical protein
VSWNEASFVSALEPLSLPLPLLSCDKHVPEPCESSTLGSSIDSWDIPSSFVFPLTDIHGTKRRFNRSWLEKYQWLRYSESENGVFCLCCVLFNSSEHAFVKNSINHTWVFYWLFLPFREKLWQYTLSGTPTLFPRWTTSLHIINRSLLINQVLRLFFLWQIFVGPKGALIGPGLKSISGWDIQSQTMEFLFMLCFVQ